MRLVLEIVSGPLSGKTIVVEEHQVVRVGRTAKADYPTEDGFMSGEHFAVEGDGNEWRLRDLKSRNGTKLNKKKVSSAELKDGDRIHAGSTDFVVRFEEAASTEELLSTLPPAAPSEEPPAKGHTKEVSPAQRAQVEKAKAERAKRKSAEREKRRSSGSISATSQPKIKPAPQAEVSGPVAVKQAVVAPVSPDSIRALESTTPGERLLHLLQGQKQPLLALIDATVEKNLPNMLRESGELYSSLYDNPETLNVAPFLVSLPPDSPLLRKMVYEGWGRGWGIYLTCPTSLSQLRDYFRRELMLKLPDGVELFSRFYEPRFFRVFLENCTPQEAEKFFGPVISYFIEAEKPEIVLEFSRSGNVVLKNGHLLTDL